MQGKYDGEEGVKKKVGVCRSEPKLQSWSECCACLAVPVCASSPIQYRHDSETPRTEHGADTGQAAQNTAKKRLVRAQVARHPSRSSTSFPALLHRLRCPPVRVSNCLSPCTSASSKPNFKLIDFKENRGLVFLPCENRSRVDAFGLSGANWSCGPVDLKSQPCDGRARDSHLSGKRQLSRSRRFPSKSSEKVEFSRTSRRFRFLDRLLSRQQRAM